MTIATDLADELVDVIFDAMPTAASLLGFRDRDDRLCDYTEAGEAALRARYSDVRARALALDPAGLSAEDKVTRSVVSLAAESDLNRFDARLVEFTITDNFTAPAAELLFVLPMMTLAEPEHADAYLARLRAVPEVLRAIGERNRAGVEAGRLPVAHLVRAAIDHIDRYLANPGTDPLRRPDLPAGGETFRAERDRLLADVVRPAFAGYRTLLAEHVLPYGRPADRGGLCWLPDGADAYARMIRTHTSTDRTAEDLHRVGLELIANLEAEYRSIGARVFGTSDLAEIRHRLRADPALRWTDAAELLAAAEATVRRAEAAAPDWFGRLPSQQCAVQPVPPGEAPGSPGAYYLFPSMDGNRPGTYFANTYKAEERLRYVAEATAFHEAVPGHHFQSVVALELTRLPLLRRIGLFNAYGEGWGLYSERLADEMGLYSDDVARLGMLAGDSVRAARLVVDTGLHALGWSRAQVVEYLTANTLLPDVEVSSETDRYIADPGQALAYMVGRLEIQRIRGGAEKSLGERFDIRAFHDTVLGQGPLPLAVLDDVVQDWVTGQG